MGKMDTLLADQKRGKGSDALSYSISPFWKAFSGVKPANWENDEYNKKWYRNMMSQGPGDGMGQVMRSCIAYLTLPK